jgi:hypothetical protein
MDMKTTKILFTIASVIISIQLQAQRLSFGPKIGYTNSTLVGNDVPDDARGVNNFSGGVFFKAQAGEIVSIQPEILYAQRGGTTKADNDPDGLSLNVDYLQVPLLIKAQIPVGDAFFPFLYAGPYGAFELDNNFNATGFDGAISFNDEADVNDFDFGAALGGGFDIQVQRFFLGFDLRYDIGMSQILQIDGEDQDYKNRAFTGFVSMGINLD